MSKATGARQGDHLGSRRRPLLHRSPGGSVSGVRMNERVENTGGGTRTHTSLRKPGFECGPSWSWFSRILQCLGRVMRSEDRSADLAAGAHEAVGLDGTPDGVGMDAELGGDRLHLAVLGEEEEAADAGEEVGRDHRATAWGRRCRSSKSPSPSRQRPSSTEAARSKATPARGRPPHPGRIPTVSGGHPHGRSRDA